MGSEYNEFRGFAFVITDGYVANICSTTLTPQKVKEVLSNEK